MIYFHYCSDGEHKSTHKIALCADIEKMYRQILVNDEQCNLQRIVWRESQKERIQNYVLKTVTYGTANAPFLAIRVLQQLANDEKEKYPIASKIMLNDFYVDDMISGCDSEQQANEYYMQLKLAFKSGGFNLRKWASNNVAFMSNIPEADREVQKTQSINIDNTIKALGIKWKTETDNFSFSINDSLDTSATTKRKLLSQVASLYDPLGWLAPVIIKPKVLLQQLWQMEKQWDDELPKIINDEWLKIKTQLPSLTAITIPRWIGTLSSSTNIEIHAFSDASEMATAAVVYIKCGDNVRLLTAKTKVAPFKKLSIPKLELCAALLASRLKKNAIESMKLNASKIKMYSDSKVALAWITSNPNRWKVFVSNKVIKKNKNVEKDCWKYVNTKDNPADCASRGLYPSELK